MHASRHFQSHDKDGSYTIQSAIPKNPMLHTNFMALCFIEPELLPIKVLHCENRNFWPSWLLWPWPWPDDRRIWTRPVVRGYIPRVRKWTSYVKAFESYHVTDIQTDTTKTITLATSRTVTTKGKTLTQMKITFSATYFHHLRLHLRPTTFGEDHIASYFLNTLVVSWTHTLLLACLTNTFTDDKNTVTYWW